MEIKHHGKVIQLMETKHFGSTKMPLGKKQSIRLMFTISLVFTLVVSMIAFASTESGSSQMLTINQQVFESSTAGWEAQGNTTTAFDPYLGIGGSGALLIRVDKSGPWPDATNTARVGTPQFEKGITATPNATYEGAVFLRGFDGSAGEARCQIREFDNGRIISTQTSSELTRIGSSWSQLKCLAQTSTEAKQLSLSIYIADAQYGENFLADNASLEITGSRPSSTQPPTTTQPPVTQPPTTDPPVSQPPTTQPTNAETKEEVIAKYEFFLGITGWSEQGNTKIAHSDTEGNGALKVSVDTSETRRYKDQTRTARVGTHQYSGGVKVTPGDNIIAKFDVKSTSSRNARCELRFYNGSKILNDASVLGSSSPLTNTFTERKCEGTAPAAATNVSLRLFVSDYGDTDVYFVDDAVISKKVAGTSDPEPVTPAPEDPIVPDPDPDTPDPVNPDPEPTAPPVTGLQSWSDSSTWGGQLPKENADVVIPAGKKVLLNTDVPKLKSLTINGELHFADRNTVLSSESIIVYGKLFVGTKDKPLNSDVVISLQGNTAPVTRTIGMHNIGSNVLAAANGGQIEIHGKDSGRMFTKLSETVLAGSKTIKLMEPVTWKTGDKIVLSSTSVNFREYDEATIASVSSDGKTIGLVDPLKYRHNSVVTSFTQGSETRSIAERGDVGLLTKNIKITGPSNATTTRFSGHTIILNDSILNVSNAEFAYLGQEGVLGRYPIHFHHTGDASASSVRNVSIHHSFSRFLTVHRTNNLLVDGGVWHDAIGHGYMLEDGIETGNKVNKILAMTVRIPAADKRLILSDKHASAFWITNPTNDLTNIIAAGGESIGIWYDFASDSDNPNKNAARNLPLGKLDNIEAHSHERGNFTAGVHAPGSGILIDGYNGNITNGRQFTNNWLAWMNGSFGIWQDGRFTSKNIYAANNGLAAFNGQGTTTDGGLLVTYSNNTLDPDGGGGGLVRFYHGQADVLNLWLANYEVRTPATSYNRAAIVDFAVSSWEETPRIKNIKFIGKGYKTLFLVKDVNSVAPTRDLVDPMVAQGHYFEDMDGSILGDGVPALVTTRDMFIKSPGEKILYPNVGVGPYRGASFGAISPKNGRGFAQFNPFTHPFSMTRLSTGETATKSKRPAVLLGERYRMNGVDSSSKIYFVNRGKDIGWYEMEFLNSNAPTSASYIQTPQGKKALLKATSEADLASKNQAGYYYDASSRKLVVRITVSGTPMPAGSGGDTSMMQGNHWYYHIFR